MLADPAGTTFAEVVYARAGQESMTGVTFSSYFPGSPPTRVKTVTNWKSNPLDQPEGYINLCVKGSYTQAYEEHCEYLSNYHVKPIATTWENFFQRCNEGMRTLSEYYLERRVYVPARNFDVEAMLRKKGIRLP